MFFSVVCWCSVIHHHWSYRCRRIWKRYGPWLEERGWYLFLYFLENRAAYKRHPEVSLYLESKDHDKQFFPQVSGIESRKKLSIIFPFFAFDKSIIFVERFNDLDEWETTKSGASCPILQNIRQTTSTCNKTEEKIKSCKGHC